jgi:hypothetical protein
MNWTVLTKYRNNKRNKPMLINLLDACSSAYCVNSQRNQRNQSNCEVFDERPDWQLPQPTQKAIKGGRLITICAVLLVAGLTYLVQ